MADAGMAGQANDADDGPPPPKKIKTLTDVRVVLTGKKQLVSSVLDLFVSYLPFCFLMQKVFYSLFLSNEALYM